MPCLECAQPSYGSNPSPYPFRIPLVVGLICSKQAGDWSLEGRSQASKVDPVSALHSRALFFNASRAKYKQISNIRIPFLFQYTSVQLQKGKELRCIFFWHSSLGTMEQVFCSPAPKPFPTPFAFSVRTALKPRNFLDGFMSSEKMVLLVARAISHPFCFLNQGSEFLQMA